MDSFFSQSLEVRIPKVLTKFRSKFTVIRRLTSRSHGILEFSLFMSLKLGSFLLESLPFRVN